MSVPRRTLVLAGSLCTLVITSITAVSAEETAVTASSETSESSEKKSTETSRETNILKRITVVESAEKVREVPGSAALIEGEEFQKALGGTDDIHRVLRQVPGVNIQEEEGYGLRPNIGFRGVPNERAAKITVMEDGVLVAPAPYTAPAAYYFPAAGRMEGVEVLKGSSQIKYGPYTTGGSLNLLSQGIPDEPTASGNVGIGNDNTSKIYLNAGNSWKYGGVLLETYQFDTDGFKDLDGGGDTGSDLEDYNLKIRLNTDPEKTLYQEVEYKFGDYSQDSDETYLGITDEDFGRRPFRRYSASQLDNIDVDHVQNHLRHYVEFNKEIDLTTTFYHNDTKRNWYKLESVNGKSLSDVLNTPDSFASELAWLQGQTSPDDALTIRENARDYYSRGIQTVLGVDFEVAETEHEVEFGARYHQDEEDRFQADDKFRMDNGRMVLTSEGAPGSQTNRVSSADAWAFYLQDKISFGKLTVTPGLRYERVNYTREDFGRTDPSRTGVDLSRADTDSDAVIPGVGVRYEVTDEIGTFVGVHKGYSPPGPSTDNDVEEEESIAYEVGVDYKKKSLISEVVFFYSDYDNLLGADTASGGGTGSGDLFNAGEVSVLGVEASIGYDLAEPFETAFSVPARLAYTYTDAEFESSFESELFGTVTDGESLTYVPEHQLYASIGAEYQDYSLTFTGNFVDSMKTEAGQVDAPNRTDAAMIFDILGEWAFSDKLKFYASVENLFDREYVVARRPAGARPGLPLTAVGGIKFKF